MDRISAGAGSSRRTGGLQPVPGQLRDSLRHGGTVCRSRAAWSGVGDGIRTPERARRGIQAGRPDQVTIDSVPAETRTRRLHDQRAAGVPARPAGHGPGGQDRDRELPSVLQVTGTCPHTALNSARRCPEHGRVDGDVERPRMNHEGEAAAIANSLCQAGNGGAAITEAPSSQRPAHLECPVP